MDLPNNSMSCGYSRLKLNNMQCVKSVWIFLVLVLYITGGTLSQTINDPSRNEDLVPTNKDGSDYSSDNNNNNNDNNNIVIINNTSNSGNGFGPQQQQPPDASNSNPAAANNNFTHPLQIKFLTKHPVVFLDLAVEKTFQFNYTLQCDHPSSMYVVMAKSVTEDVATIIKGNPVKISCMFGTIIDQLPGKQTQRNNINDSNNNNNNNNNNNSHSDLNSMTTGKQMTVEDSNTDTNTVHKPSGGATTTNGAMAGNEHSRTNFEISGQFELRFESHRIGRSFFLMFATKVSGPGAQIPPGYGMMMKQQRPNGMSNSNTNTNMKGGEQKQPLMQRMTNDSTNNPKPETQAASSAKGGGSSRSGAGAGGSGGAGGRGGAGGLPPNTVVKSMIIVMKLPTAVDEMFRIILYVVIITATIGMGIKVELEVVKEVMKKPLGPCIGLFCQYICMPLIAYGVAKAVPQPSAAISLGLFTCGIVPGGGASNFWCYLLGGDVTLSVTMTTISSIAALGLIPMWLFTLGENFKDETADIHVPYPKILETLAIVVLPIFAGMLLKRLSPKAAKFISKILKPFLVIIVLFLLAVGIYANFFIFAMIRPMQILAGCLLPYVGYLIGGGIALLTCRSWQHVKTIAIETGIQNTGIAFMIVFFSLKPPDNQLAVVAPAASAIMTPLPLLVITIFYTIYLRYKKKEEQRKDGTAIDTKEDLNIQGKEAANRKQTSLWDKIRGKGSETQTPDMEEMMLNKEIFLEKGPALS